MDNTITNINNRLSASNINTNDRINNNKNTPTYLPIDLNIEHLPQEDINNIMNNKTFFLPRIMCMA